MKKLKNLKFIAIICLLMVCNSCSNDNSLEIIDETNQTIQNENFQSKNGTSCDLELLVTYTFDPFTTENEKLIFIEAFRLEMAQEFTVCTVIEAGRDCPNIEKWIVNGDEYLGDPKTGGTSNTSGGKGKITIIKPGGKVFGEDCFSSNFPF